MRRRDKFSIFGSIAFLARLMNPRPLFTDFNLRGLSPSEKLLADQADAKLKANAVKPEDRKLAAKLRQERRAELRAVNRIKSLAGQGKL